MKRLLRRSWLLAAVLAASLTAAARAGALDDRVPQDSIFYVGWAGADTLGPQYANSNLKGILDASQIPDFVSKQLPKLIDMARAQNPAAPQIIAKLQQGLNVAWRHPTAFYFCPLDFANPQMPGFRFGFICDAGNDAKPTVDLLNEVLAQAPQSPFLPIKVVQDGTTVMVTFGKADTLADLRQGGGLAAAPAYKAAMAKVVQPDPAMAMYMDMTKILATVNDALAKIPNIPPDSKVQIPAMFDAMGYSSLTQMAVLGGFDAKGWTQHSYVGINGPKKGMVALMDGGPLSDAVLALVPKEAAAFAAWKLDFQKYFTESRNLVGKVDPQVQRDFDSAIADVNQNLGLNIEKDILAPLGDEWVFYRAPIAGEGGNSPALVMKLKDGPTLTKSLAKLEALYNGMPNAPIRIEKVTAAQTQVSTLALMQYSIAWCVKGDTLYVSSLSGISGAIKQVENKSPSILENPDYRAARAALPANVKPLSISYSNPAKLYPELRLTALGFFPIIRRAGFDVPMDLLPEGDAVSRFMPPGATIAWSDANGIYGAGKQAFPGSELIGGQNLGQAAVGVLAGVSVAVMPRLAESRTISSRSVDMANLRGISQSALVYAADHKDAMPDDLARLVAEGMIAPKSLVSRRAGTMPLEMTPALEKMAKDDFAKFAAEVAAHSDFVYLGRDTKSEVNAGVIVAYEKSSPQTPDGLNVAFQDAHVEFVMWPRMAAAFEATNAYLKKNGKSEVDVKALMRAAGYVDGAGLP
jgi:hypothetical protein